jgi:hypothetical protein
MSYVTSSGCSCCTMAAVPLSLSAVISQCTDVDTDSREADMQPAASSWPADIREQVWKDRLLFRQQLKARTPQLLAVAAQPAFAAFLSSLSSSALSAAFTLSTPALHLLLRSSFPFSPPFHHLLHAVVTQLSHFPLTLYPLPADCATQAELVFACCLKLTADGQLTVDAAYWAVKDEDGGFSRRLQEVTRGKLLPRLRRRRRPDNTTAREEEQEEEEAAGRRFRSDRRLLRLWLFRCGLEKLQQQWSSSKTASIAV